MPTIFLENFSDDRWQFTSKGKQYMALKLKKWRHKTIGRQDAYNVISILNTRINFEKYTEKCGEFLFHCPKVSPGGIVAEYRRQDKGIYFYSEWPYLREPLNQQLGVNSINGLAQCAKNSSDFLSILLAHEIGHKIHAFIDFEGQGQTHGAIFKPIYQQWKSAFNAGNGISKTARMMQRDITGIAENEYFAETFAAFIHFPEELKKIDPAGYKLMRNVVNAPW